MALRSVSMLISRLINVNTWSKCRISTFVQDDETIVLTDDASIFVCWHPEKPFPYEFSKPVVKNEVISNNILKVENKEEIYKVFRNKNQEYVRKELMAITYTTKHRWFPRSRDKKAKNTKPDRPYL